MHGDPRMHCGLSQPGCRQTARPPDCHRAVHRPFVHRQRTASMRSRCHDIVYLSMYPHMTCHRHMAYGTWHRRGCHAMQRHASDPPGTASEPRGEDAFPRDLQWVPRGTNGGIPRHVPINIHTTHIHRLEIYISPLRCMVRGGSRRRPPRCIRFPFHGWPRESPPRPHCASNTSRI